MASQVQIAGNGLSFFPLYWIHHDSWQYDTGPDSPVRQHPGHTHLFMLGFPWDTNATDAYSGAQTFSFTIQDLWGPRSSDPNQSYQYKVVGTPKWYWHVEELWRRVYIQQWDEKVKDIPDGLVLGRRGIRWDASQREMVLGPFREGYGFSPFYIEGGGRTLPIEYHNNEDKKRTHRDNYVMDKAQQMIAEWNASYYGQHFPRTFDPLQWNLDHGNFLRGHPAAKDPWTDALYISPIVEYKKVVQLDWERYPGHALNHDKSDTVFGDGWSNTVQIPYVDPFTRRVNSPFSPSPGIVAPPGYYYGTNTKGDPLVPDAQRLRYRKRSGGLPYVGFDGTPHPGGVDFTDEPFGLPAIKAHDPDWVNRPEGNESLDPPADYRPNRSEELRRFEDPYEKGDGRWVQQCLGGLVQARADVTFEHKLGGRFTQTVTATQLMPTNSFAGNDQYMPG